MYIAPYQRHWRQIGSVFSDLSLSLSV